MRDFLFFSMTILIIWNPCCIFIIILLFNRGLLRRNENTWHLRLYRPVKWVDGSQFSLVNRCKLIFRFSSIYNWYLLLLGWRYYWLLGGCVGFVRFRGLVRLIDRKSFRKLWLFWLSWHHRWYVMVYSF